MNNEIKVMSRQHHYLKTVNPYFMDIYNGDKKFEVRFNDRNYQVGDVLHLKEFVPPETFTGREIDAEVMYILDNPSYCKDGFVVMSIDVYSVNFLEGLCEKPEVQSNA